MAQQRTLTVALKAAVQGYTGGMGRAAAATGTLEASIQRTQRAGMAMTRVGDRMTRGVTLPLVAAGAAAVKMAVDFDNELTKMQSLAGVTAGEIDGMRDSILDLAGETGQAPRELAEGMFFIQSAGISGADAMEVLDRSARAAATGMGTTQEMADLLTGAMQIYGTETLSATEAADVFTAAVRNSKTDVDQVATAITSVIPQADALGVSFLDVSGALAAMAATNSNMSENATQLNGVFEQLTNVTPEFRTRLTEVGVDADRLQGIMGEEGGLVEGMRMLWDATDGNATAFAALFPNIQAARGGLSIAANDFAVVDAVMDDMADSAGSLDNAFSTWSESMGAQNAQAWGKFQAQMIRAGDIIMPIAAQMVDTASDILDAFSKLPAGVQQSVVWFGLFAAAAGPVLSVGGRMVIMLGKLGAALSNLAVPAGSVSGAFRGGTTSGRGLNRTIGRTALGFGGAGLAIGGALLVLENWISAQQEAKAAGEEWAEAIAAAGGELEGTAAEVIASSDHWSRLRDRIHETGIDAQLFTDAIEGPRDGLQEVTDAFNEFSGSVTRDRFGPTTDALEELADGGNDLAAALLDVVNSGDMSGEQLLVLANELLDANEAGARANEIFDAQEGILTDAGGAADGASESTQQLRGAMEEAGVDVEALGEDFDSLTDAVAEYNDALRALFDPQFAMLDAIQGNEEANLALEQAYTDLDEAVAEHGEGSAEAEQAQRDLDSAVRDATRSAIDYEVAANDLAAAIEAGEVSVEDAEAALDSWVDQGLISRDTAREMGAQFRLAARRADDLEGTRKVSFQTPGLRDAKARIDAIRDSVNSIPDRKPVMITVGVRSIGADQFLKRQTGGPVKAGLAYRVGELGEELFVPTVPGKIVPHHAVNSMTKPMASPSPVAIGGGGPTVITLRASDRLGQALMEALRSEVRERGRGDVQVALGAR